MPETATKKVALWPPKMDWLLGCVEIAGATVTPMPAICTATGEPSCENPKEAVPDIAPAEAGAKVTAKVALAPGFKFTGNATPPIVNPAPEASAWEIKTAWVPELVMVRV